MFSNKSIEYKAWELLAKLNRVDSMQFSAALKYLNVNDETLWRIINNIYLNNHKFYNPTNIKWFAVTTDMQLMIISDNKTKKEMLKDLKIKMKELKATIKGAYHG